MRKSILTKEEIESVLRRFDNVKWDRFVMWGKTFSGGITVSGWIDREDSYKDYICLDIYTDSSVSAPDAKIGRMNVDYMTSSAKYSLLMFKILNDGKGFGHRKCRRVEDYFDV